MAPPAGRTLAWSVALAAGAADQVSKAAVVRFLQPGEAVTVLPGFFDLTLVMNPGGIFGILRDADGPIRSFLFSLVPLAVIVLLVWYGRSLPAGRRWSHTALGLILGGAVGNLADRIRLGHVVDFLDAYLGRHHWPAFNLADSGICIGVAMLLAESLLFGRSGGGTEPAAPPSVP